MGAQDLQETEGAAATVSGRSTLEASTSLGWSRRHRGTCEGRMLRVHSWSTWENPSLGSLRGSQESQGSRSLPPSCRHSLWVTSPASVTLSLREHIFARCGEAHAPGVLGPKMLGFGGPGSSGRGGGWPLSFSYREGLPRCVLTSLSLGMTSPIWVAWVWDSPLRGTSKHTATSFLIPSVTLGMTVFSLGSGFHNCAVGEGAPTLNSPCPRPSLQLWAGGGEEGVGRWVRGDWPALFHASGAHCLRVSCPKGALWSVGQTTKWPRQVSFSPIRQRRLIRGGAARRLPPDPHLRDFPSSESHILQKLI